MKVRTVSPTDSVPSQTSRPSIGGSGSSIGQANVYVWEVGLTVETVAQTGTAPGLLQPTPASTTIIPTATAVAQPTQNERHIASQQVVGIAVEVSLVVLLLVLFLWVFLRCRKVLRRKRAEEKSKRASAKTNEAIKVLNKAELEDMANRARIFELEVRSLRYELEGNGKVELGIYERPPEIGDKRTTTMASRTEHSHSSSEKPLHSSEFFAIFAECSSRPRFLEVSGAGRRISICPEPETHVAEATAMYPDGAT